MVSLCAVSTIGVSINVVYNFKKFQRSGRDNFHDHLIEENTSPYNLLNGDGSLSILKVVKSIGTLFAIYGSAYLFGMFGIFSLCSVIGFSEYLKKDSRKIKTNVNKIASFTKKSKLRLDYTFYALNEIKDGNSNKIQNHSVYMQKHKYDYERIDLFGGEVSSISKSLNIIRESLIKSNKNIEMFDKEVFEEMVSDNIYDETSVYQSRIDDNKIEVEEVFTEKTLLNNEIRDNLNSNREKIFTKYMETLPKTYSKICKTLKLMNKQNHDFDNLLLMQSDSSDNYDNQHFSMLLKETIKVIKNDVVFIWKLEVQLEEEFIALFSLFELDYNIIFWDDDDSIINLIVDVLDETDTIPYTIDQFENMYFILKDTIDLVSSVNEWVSERLYHEIYGNNSSNNTIKVINHLRNSYSDFFNKDTTLNQKIEIIRMYDNNYKPNIKLNDSKKQKIDEF